MRPVDITPGERSSPNDIRNKTRQEKDKKQHRKF